MYIRKPDYASVFCTVAISLLLCAPFISESEAFSQRKFREQREAGISINTDEDLAAFGIVPGFSGSSENYGKIPDSSADLIFQSSPGLGRSIGEGGERRNIQPRRVSGFAIYNFAPDPSAATAYAATTVGPEVTVQDPFSLASSVTFADLVQRARQRNGFASPSSTQASTFEATTSTKLATSQAISQSTTHVPVTEESSISRAASRYRGQPVQVVRSKKRPQLTSQQLQKIQKNANRFIRRQQRQRATTTWTTTETTSSTTTPLISTETSQQPTTTQTTTTIITTTASTTAETTTMASTTAETATSTTDTTTPEPTTLSTTVAPAPTTLSLPQLFTNFETVSARLVTRNVTSTSSVTDTPMPRESKMTDDIITTAAPTRKQRQNDEGNSPTYDYYYSETTPTYDYYEESDTTNVPTVPLVLSTTPSPIVAFLLSSTTERQVVNIVAETTTSSVQSTTDTLPVQESQDTTFEVTSSTMSTTSTSEEAVTTSMEAVTSSDRSPRTSDVEKWDKPEEQHLDGKEPDIFSGKYYEVNPGRYFEDNPGQYYEDNAGQYWEENPGQYYDPHLPKGQYHEKDPGQYRDQLDVQVVEVKYTDDAQVYNVQSKVDNFIIGEYGTISKSNGQTIQGVRYTAVDDQSIDPKLIYETLHKFFPMSQQQQQQQTSEEEEEEESAT